MECFLQYLDDIDDMFGALGLIYEPVRRICLGLCAALFAIGIIGSAVWLALLHPPLALGICLLLFVTLLYRAVTAPTRGRLQPS